MTAAPLNTNPATMNVDPAASFPCRLHRMLSDIEQLAETNPSMAHLPKIISWSADGRSFKIHDRKKFVDTVMPIFFSRLKYSSFVRGVSGHGFTRLRCQGPTNGAMFHPDFLRDEPHLASSIEKIKKKSKAELAQQAANRPIRRLSESSFGSTSTAGKSDCAPGETQLNPKAPRPQPNILDENLFAFMRQPSVQSYSGNNNNAATSPFMVNTSSSVQQSPVAVEEKKSSLFGMDSFLSDKFLSLSNSGCTGIASCNSSVEESILADLDLPGDDFECPWDFEPLPLP